MGCTNPTGTTKGILIGWDPSDTGDRPLAAGTPFWVSPNLRLALLADVAGLQQDPAK